MRLLVHARQVHTEKGAHELELSSWSDWAKRVKVQPLADAATAHAAIEAALGEARNQLPWLAR